MQLSLRLSNESNPWNALPFTPVWSHINAKINRKAESAIIEL